MTRLALAILAALLLAACAHRPEAGQWVPQDDRSQSQR